MTSSEEEIYKWLITGIQQPGNKIGELFYFDKTTKEFFSIVITDYFLFDENLNIAGNVTSNYSFQNVEKLQDKMRRIENNSAGIIALPRLGEDLEIEYVMQKVDSFLNLNAISVEEAVIWIPEETGHITIDLEPSPGKIVKKPWWKFW